MYRHKIHYPYPLTKEQISANVALGVQFRAFKYQVSLFVRTFYFYSPVHLIKNEKELKRYISRYNFITTLLGVWHFPIGPFNVLRTRNFNKNGGIDFTGNVLHNQVDFKEKEQVLSIADNKLIFNPVLPETASKLVPGIKELLTKNQHSIFGLYSGRYMKVAVDESPFYCFGVDTLREDFQEMETLILKEFHAHFSPTTPVRIYFKKRDPELYIRMKHETSRIYPAA